jgi:hypothetical protein
MMTKRGKYGGLPMTNLKPAKASLPQTTPQLPKDAHPVCIMDSQPWHCRFIVGEPNGPRTIFCGAQVERDKPYCPFHCRIAYTKTEARA